VISSPQNEHFLIIYSPHPRCSCQDDQVRDLSNQKSAT